MILTFQTRVCAYVGLDRAAGDAALSAYAELYGRVERKLFAELAAGGSAMSLKNGYLKRYGIPARMFNGVRVSLEAKVASVRGPGPPETAPFGDPAIQAGGVGSRHGDGTVDNDSEKS